MKPQITTFYLVLKGTTSKVKCLACSEPLNLYYEEQAGKNKLKFLAVWSPRILTE